MTLASVDFDYLRALVKNHTAIVLDAGKEYLAETRLAPLVGEQGCSSVQELLEVLRRQNFNGLHRKVLDAMTNNETWFFRDCNCFAALTGVVLPEIMKRRAVERRIDIWSAACSSGQEPYSIAMAIREEFNLPGWKFSILGTDFCTTILERAKSGLYRQMEVNRGLPTKLLTRYFTQHKLHWQLKPEILSMVKLQLLNLAEPWKDAVPSVDIVLLRNVLIYFDMQTRKEILGQVRRILRPDGFMFLGCAETTLNVDPGFQLVQAKDYVCYKLKDR
ncbi:MAG: protein-glutamate O-methyltransferase CheR [Candidatus Korobacteraceae bacterium]